MKKITKEELAQVLNLHKKWRNDEEEGVQADLSNMDLLYANLSYADLRYANLSYADLRYANLSYADLRGANLSSADLQKTGVILYQSGPHLAVYTPDGTLSIGCERHPVSEWLTIYEKLGKQHNYEDTEIEAYGNFIKSLETK